MRNRLKILILETSFATILVRGQSGKEVFYTPEAHLAWPKYAPVRNNFPPKAKFFKGGVQIF